STGSRGPRSPRARAARAGRRPRPRTRARPRGTAPRRRPATGAARPSRRPLVGPEAEHDDRDPDRERPVVREREDPPAGVVDPVAEVEPLPLVHRPDGEVHHDGE
ncbi:MAG: hypothetical protein ACK55I_14330, partial [bacterium]